MAGPRKKSQKAAQKVMNGAKAFNATRDALFKEDLKISSLFGKGSFFEEQVKGDPTAHLTAPATKENPTPEVGALTKQMVKPLKNRPLLPKAKDPIIFGDGLYDSAKVAPLIIENKGLSLNERAAPGAAEPDAVEKEYTQPAEKARMEMTKEILESKPLDIPVGFAAPATPVVATPAEPIVPVIVAPSGKKLHTEIAAKPEKVVPVETPIVTAPSGKELKTEIAPAKVTATSTVLPDHQKDYEAEQARADRSFAAEADKARNIRAKPEKEIGLKQGFFDTPGEFNRDIGAYAAKMKAQEETPEQIKARMAREAVAKPTQGFDFGM